MDIPTADEAVWFASAFQAMVENIERAVLGRTEVVEASVLCLFSQGHLLLEDVPGSGKSTLARSLARCVASSQSRIQFTPDLSPADILGTSVLDEQTGRYKFYAGPIFHSFIVADEINRASPRTQSALLEVMEEGRVTVRGVSNTIGPPFMVIATQNPVDTEGTFPLPLAQLDRFLLKLVVGHPDSDSALALLAESAVRDRSTLIEPILHPPELSRACLIASSVYADASLLRYVIALAEATRTVAGVKSGVSVRGALSYVRAAKTWAVAHGRTYVVPQDVRELSHLVLDHRVAVWPEAAAAGLTAYDVVESVFRDVPAPVALESVGSVSG